MGGRVRAKRERQEQEQEPQVNSQQQLVYKSTEDYEEGVIFCSNGLYDQLHVYPRKTAHLKF